MSKRCSGACASFHAKLFEPHFLASLDGAVGLAVIISETRHPDPRDSVEVVLVVCPLHKAPYL